jgi:glycine/D-amino acid oxidase-like deaminating enzyme
MVATSEGEAFAYEPQSGYADAYSVTTGYAAAARRLGATIRAGSPVTSIEITGNRVTAVLTADTRVETPIAVVAAGPWSESPLATVGVDVPLHPLRQQVIMLHRSGDSISNHPIIGDVVQDLSARPDVGNLTLADGAGDGSKEDPDTYNQSVDMPVVEKTFTKLVARVPAMEDAVFQGGWSGLFTTTPDWHPILDRVEGIDGLYCAIGFSGHGFKLSPMIALAMSELITEGKGVTIDISMLTLKRFAEGKQMRSRYAMQVLA